MARSAKNTAPAVDEDGVPWPPATCPAAAIFNYGGHAHSPFNGVVVQPEEYQPELGFFAVALTVPVTDGRKRYHVGDTVLCRFNELIPLNSFTGDVLASWYHPDCQVYEDNVYDLRDILGAHDIHVTAASVASWEPEQLLRVLRYTQALVNHIPHPKPEVLR